MLKVRPRSAFVAPCIPTRALKPPAGPEWVHEIKHDGYRLQVRRDGDVVRLFTRKGYDWSDRYPAIAATAMKLRAQSFTLDGEACVCGPDGVAVFDALHRRGTVREAMLYAFDLLELDGDDLRGMPLGDRKKRLARTVRRRRRVDGRAGDRRSANRPSITAHGTCGQPFCLHVQVSVGSNCGWRLHLWRGCPAQGGRFNLP
jgi:ATP-dependent DNA ligase